MRQHLFGKRYVFLSPFRSSYYATTSTAAKLTGEVPDQHPIKQFWVVVDGERKNDSADEWRNRPVSVESSWDHASEQEKFEVLAAMRKLYSATESSNIRGSFGQSPDQVGQREGFSRLRYRHADRTHGMIDIVKATEAYCLLSPFEN